MFGRLKELTRTLPFRVGLWYASIFLISAILVLWLVYFLLGAAIDRKSQDTIEARLREYVAVYDHGGVSALRDWTDRINNAHTERMFFVRVTKSDGTVEMSVMPEDWSKRDLDLLPSPASAKEWVRVTRDSDVDLIVASACLPDSTVIQVGRSSDSRSKLLAKFRGVFGIVILPLIMLGLVGGMILINRMIQPVRSVINAAGSIINTGRMDVRVPIPSANDELRDLAVLFNRMLVCNEELFRALHDSLDNVAHDLRTPLARLRATLETGLSDDRSADAMRESIAQALEESEQVQTIITTLMEVAQAETGSMQLHLEHADLSKLMSDAVELYAHVAEEKNVAVATRLGDGCLATVDPTRVRQVFANLLDNAIKYTPSGGRILISVGHDDGEIAVNMSDSGVGIDENELPRIWERLYRADKSRGEPGLGLGLNLVKAIVEAHHGRVEVTSVPRKGSEFRIYLPDSIATLPGPVKESEMKVDRKQDSVVVTLPKA